MCREFASEMKINVWFRQGGYFFLARTSDDARAPREERRRCRTSAGSATRMLTPKRGEEASFPSSTSSGVVAASYNPDDGVVFPWPFVWGYAQAARKLGVEVVTCSRRRRLRNARRAHRGGRVRRLQRTERDARRRATIRTHRVVNAAGAWSPEIATHARRRAPEQAPPPRDLLDRAAQTVAQARSSPTSRDGLYFSPVDARRDRRRRRQRARRPGLDQQSSPRFPRQVRPRRSCAPARCSRA